jgi:hypothetical protein
MIDLEDGDSLGSLPEWLKQRGPVLGNGPLSPAAPGVQPAEPDESTYADRLSVGRRIAGGIKQPSYMPPTQTGTPDVGQPPVANAPFDPNLLPESIRPRTMPAPNEIAKPPVGVNSQRRLDLMAEESRLNKPIDPSAVDPKTGKPLYRYGTGAKIIGTIANALGAFGAASQGRSYTPVDYFGNNARYDREENLRKGRLAGVESDLGEQEKLESSQEQAYRDAISQAFKAQVGEKDIALGKAAEENAATRAELAKFKIDQGPTNKTADAVAERTQVADRMDLKGEERKSYVLTGRLPNEGRQPAELDIWMAAFKRDNGRAPTADEIANRRSRQSSKADQIEKDKDTALARVEAEVKSQLGKLDISAYTKDASKVPGETPSQWRQRRQQEIYLDLEKRKSQIQKDYEVRAAANSNAGPVKPTAHEVANLRAAANSSAGASAKPLKSTQLAPVDPTDHETVNLRALANSSAGAPANPPKPTQAGPVDPTAHEVANMRATYNSSAGAPASSPRGTTAPPKPTQAAPPGRVWVYDKKTGNRGTIPASQLKSATSGRDAKYGTW